jgi:hypothetical protein
MAWLTRPPNLMGFNLQTSYPYCVTTQATRVQSVMNRVSDIKIKVNFIQFLSSKKIKNLHPIPTHLRSNQQGLAQKMSHS